MHRRTLTIAALIIACGAGATALQPQKQPVPPQMTASAALPVTAPATTTATISSHTPVANHTASPAPQPHETAVTPSQPSTTTATVSTETATLVVGEKRYPFEVATGETIADAMRFLASSSDFRYVGREYPGMGIFIDSIDSVAGTKTTSWFLYINGKSADKGASQTTVHPHDIIEWKLEQQ